MRTIVGGFATYDDAPGQDGLFTELSAAKADGYDAVSMYGYAFAAPYLSAGRLPQSGLAAIGAWIRTEASARSPLPLVPVVSDGSDRERLDRDRRPRGDDPDACRRRLDRLDRLDDVRRNHTLVG